MAITRSTSAIKGRIAACACASIHSFLRKLRSTLTRAPARRAAVTAVLVAAAARSPSAGVMPLTWNHAAPSNTASHATASAGISLIAECARS